MKAESLDIETLLKRFYATPEWIALRNKVMETRNLGRCQNCQVKFSFDKWCEPVVDHILPLRYFPELGLEVDNCQVLCSGCNYEKGSYYGKEAERILASKKKKRREYLMRCCYRGDTSAVVELSYLDNPVIPNWIKTSKNQKKKKRKKEKMQSPPTSNLSTEKNLYYRNRSSLGWNKNG